MSRSNFTIAGALACAVTLAFGVQSEAAVVFQADLQYSGATTNQTTQSGWTAWETGLNSAGSPTSLSNTLGGVGVTIAATGTGGQYLTGRGGDAATQLRSSSITGTSWNDMVEDLWAARSGDGNMTVALTGLTAGLTYTLTGWHNDSYTHINAGFAADAGYSVTPSVTTGTLVGVADAGASTNVRNGARSDSDFNTSVISFTSDGLGNATILLTGASTGEFLALSGLQLDVSEIPAPAALPAGLAMLGLIAARRRRNA